MSDLATPLIAWYRANARDLPWRRAGFGAWGVLVSEFMLQQTPVNRVIPHLEAWLDRWMQPGGHIEADDADVLAAAIDAALAEPADPTAMRKRAVEMAGPAMIARYTELLTA